MTQFTLNILQNIVESINFNDLPAEWINFDFVNFSANKKLFNYQENALKNAAKILYKYYIDCYDDKIIEQKYKFFNLYKKNGLTSELDLVFDNKKENKKNLKLFAEYPSDFQISGIKPKLEFKYFVNRMSFWMATGSGKTIVIVKLIQLLAHLIQNKQIPENEILFLTHRDDLIEQFKEHINEFNSFYKNKLKINLFELKSYADVKRSNIIKFGNEVNVFYYRSDLVSDEQKDKIIDFRNFDNFGKWYIILDEAHKGDKGDSKSQNIFTILSRNGFLFNFSATFTDSSDYATCVFNFNLSKFIEEGYGKHIYISKQNIEALKTKTAELETEKQKIILKLFILFSALVEQYKKLKEINKNLYHKPLFLTLVNSVNTEDSDLELFFRELEKIATKIIDENLITVAKEDLINEFSDNSANLFFEQKSINVSEHFRTIIRSIDYNKILENFFNAKTAGKIEVLKIPKNNKELVFKLKTSDKPFALLKIGDISEWIKSKLSNYDIIEKYEDESIFQKLNQSDEINILMGSRSFYEGWDSNRPNIILYINIGKSDAKKFVLQSIGRGVRIEPLPYKRKRALFLLNNNEIDKSLYESIENYINEIETLFIYGTKPDNLNEIIQTLSDEKKDVLIGHLFDLNPDIKDKILLIPEYKFSDKLIAEERNVIKYAINDQDFERAKKYFNYLEDKVLVCKYDCNIRVLEKLKDGFNKQKYNFFEINKSIPSIKNEDVLLSRIFSHFTNKLKEFDTFKNLEQEIIHFKKITVDKRYVNHITEKVTKIKNSKNREQRKVELKQQLASNLISIDEFTTKYEELFRTTTEKEVEVVETFNGKKLFIQLITNHYYIPVILSDDEKIELIKHIIKVKSEIKFLEHLLQYIQSENNFFKKLDWWYFSKIDETLDEVYIPYINGKTNRVEKFKPDFIFWLKKNNQYTILFIDPKGTEHTDSMRKINGYRTIFENENGKPKIFNFNGLTIKVLLFYFKGNTSSLLPEYQNYWISNLNDIVDKI